MAVMLAVPDGSEGWAARIAAARAQALTVPGETTMAELVRELAAEALETRTKIARLDRDLVALLAVHPDGVLIQSLPGMGAVLAAEFIACVGDIRRFRRPMRWPLPQGSRL